MAGLTLMSELINDGFDWIEPFKENVDLFIYQVIEPLEAQRSPYNPYLVEKNLASLSNSIDVALSMRSAINDLEARAILQAQEYSLFKKNWLITKKLEVAAWVKNQRAAETKHFTAAVEEFSNSMNALGKGFEAATQASLSSSKAAVAGEITRTKGIDEKWLNISLHQKSLQRRHKQSGHPLNYGEQATRTKYFLEEELKTLYFLAKSVSLGFSTIFQLSDPGLAQLPELIEPSTTSDTQEGVKSYIELIGLWARRLARELTIIKQKESVFDITISAMQPMATDKALVSPQSFVAAMKSDGKIELNLSDYFPKELNEVRVIGIGLSISHVYSKITTEFSKISYNTKAIVFTPPQTNLSDPSSDVKRRPILINDVTRTNPDGGIKFTQDPHFQNYNPKGIWTIQLADYFLNTDNLKAFPKLKRSDANVFDIKLHLLLASSLDNNVDNWAGLF